MRTHRPNDAVKLKGNVFCIVVIVGQQQLMFHLDAIVDVTVNLNGTDLRPSLSLSCYSKTAELRILSVAVSPPAVLSI